MVVGVTCSKCTVGYPNESAHLITTYTNLCNFSRIKISEVQELITHTIKVLQSVWLCNSRKLWAADAWLRFSNTEFLVFLFFFFSFWHEGRGEQWQPSIGIGWMLHCVLWQWSNYLWLSQAASKASNIQACSHTVLVARIFLELLTLQIVVYTVRISLETLMYALAISHNYKK